MQMGSDDIKKTEETTVFFSYSRVDQQHAIPIIKFIEEAGYNVWWDGMLEGGTDYLKTTEHALESAKAIVVLWSKTSVTSHWVRDEAMSGRVRERLVPLTLDGTIAPLGFRQVQLIDFENWKGRIDAPNAQELCRVLDVLHDRPAGSRPLPPKAAPKPISRRALMLGAAGAGALAMGGLALSGKLPVGGPKLLNNAIAVLPFQNLSGDAAQDYISSGLSAELRSKLAFNDALMVVARSSSEAVSKLSLNAREISKRLGVAHILDGNISGTGDQLKVTTELIDGQTGFSRWVKDFKFSSDDILMVQNDIAVAVTQALTRDVSNGQLAPESGSTQNAAAFSEYLKGVALFRSNISRESNQKALEHIDIAVKLDPNFGSAWAAKARILNWFSATSSSTVMSKEFLQGAMVNAEKAVSISPDLADAHSTLADILFTSKLDIKGAKAPFEKSRALGGGSSVVLARYANYMADTGQDTAALSAITRAVELDPLNQSRFRALGYIHYAARRYEEAIAAIDRALAINPNHRTANGQKGLALIALGRLDEGLLSCEAEGNPYMKLSCLAIGHHKRGDSAAADAAMEELVKRFGDAGAYQQAQILAQRGQLEEAMSALKLAVDVGDPGASMAKTDPLLDPIRGRGGFSDVLAKLGFTV